MNKYPYAVMSSYPHMGAKDAAIWARFLVKFPEVFDEVQYDLPTGAGESVPDGTDPQLQKDWEYLTKYKCDVIGFKNGVPTIIEVKPRAGLASIGQVISYDALYQEYQDREARPDLVILTDERRNDMDWLCEEFGITLIVV